MTDFIAMNADLMPPQTLPPERTAAVLVTEAVAAKAAIEESQLSLQAAVDARLTSLTDIAREFLQFKEGSPKTPFVEEFDVVVRLGVDEQGALVVQSWYVKLNP